MSVIENKIAELLAESQKLEELKAINGQDPDAAADKSSTSTSAKATIVAKTNGQVSSSDDNGDHDNDDNDRNNNFAPPAPGVTKDTSRSGQGGAGSEPQPSVKDPVAGMYKAAGAKVDVSPGGVNAGMAEDVAALVDGEDLSEEFKAKAATIFEAAVVSRIKTELVKIQEQYDTQLVEEFVKIKEELVEKVDGYLGYIAEQWMKQNEIALESGIKSELAESFIDGIKRVFEEHYVDVPAEKYDVLGSLEDQVGELESKLNETVNANIEMSKQIAEMQKGEVIAKLSEGLTVTETEKFESLAKEIVCEDAESYTKKLETIRESYFKQAAPVAKDTVVTGEPSTDEQLISESVAQYASAIRKLNK
jgi:hypothetical protein